MGMLANPCLRKSTSQTSFNVSLWARSQGILARPRTRHPGHRTPWTLWHDPAYHGAKDHRMSKFTSQVSEMLVIIVVVNAWHPKKFLILAFCWRKNEKYDNFTLQK